MCTIAIYSLKGGVGKTSLAVNLAWCAATLSSRRTLLWDLDAQAAATYLVKSGRRPKRLADSVYEEEVKPDKMIRETDIDRLDLLVADRSLRSLDSIFRSIGKKKRLARIIGAVAPAYDRVIVDSPPGLTEISDQLIRAADIVIVPVIPSPLSQRAFGEVARHIEKQHKGKTAILPVHMMVDRRRSLHGAALEANPDWPVIPYASVVERMADRRQPVGAFAPNSPAAHQFARLWRGIEKRIAKL